ncbi:hypothetical protein [Clostridium mediterraneense]|uniref:hypothetical protein n=1 Tax=Clostridium mediterraneense TaxID=1805472 RepID=UPI00082FCF04|nr:hypothetical protein [Clostridium mediterraneense]
MISAENAYILIMPDKTVAGVEDIEYARAFVNTYYEIRVRDYHEKEEFSDYDLQDEDMRNGILVRIGQNEGHPLLYDTDSVIEAIRESELFDSEKEILIKKLLGKDIKFDAEKYGLESLIVDVEPKTIFDD